MVKELRLALRAFLISFFAHPTKSTAAIVVIRRCFIFLQLSNQAEFLLCQLHPIVLLLEKRFTPISEFNRASGALEFADLAPLF